MRKSVLVTVSVLVGLGLSALPAQARSYPSPVPIPQQTTDAGPVFIGDVAVPAPVTTRAIPQNPSMSTNPFSNLHNDTYMSDTYPIWGPLGRGSSVSSTWLGTQQVPVAIVVGMTIDRAGRLVAGAVKTDLQTAHVQLTLIHPTTLKTLATFDLPGQTATAGFRPAGAYFYSDERDRTVVGTPDREVWVISHTASSFTVEETYDLTAAIPEGDAIQALQPDFSGHIWFTSKGNQAHGGVVGTLDLDSGEVLGTYPMPVGERIVNSHAADENGGVYIASTTTMYRFDADPDGAPAVTWSAFYGPGARVKPGQTDVGTGTTPTLVGSDYVTITDNNDPYMNVLVYRRDTGELTCTVPVFEAGEGSTENSLVATDTSIIVENNYGYTNTNATTGGHSTTPGLTRIDLVTDSADGVTCQEAWTNDTVIIPTVVTKMSLANGLIYTYTKPVSTDGIDRWYFTALDFRTGEIAYQQLAGTGILYNNHYAPVYLSPHGTFYVGVLGGIVAMNDTPRPWARVAPASSLLGAPR